MRCTPVAAGRVADLSRIGFGVGDEFRNGLDRKRRMHLEYAIAAIEARHRYDVAHEVEVKLIVERDVEHVVDAEQEQRIAIGWRSHDRFSGDVTAAARPVFDHELLTQPVGKPLRHEAGPGVCGTASRETDNDTHGP